MKENKPGRLYAIAVIDSQYLRDFKLRSLSDESESEQPEYDKLLKINGSYPTLTRVTPRTCHVTKKLIRPKITSASRWKTIAGCKAALNRIESSEHAKRVIAQKMVYTGATSSAQTTTSYQLYIVDITDCWNDTITSDIEIEMASHEVRLSRLKNKLINTEK
jgi:hypothetical protein